MAFLGVLYWFGVGKCIPFGAFANDEGNVTMHDGIQSYGSLGVFCTSFFFLLSFLFYLDKPVCWLDMVGFQDHICFPFFFLMFGLALGGKLRIIGKRWLVFLCPR